MTQKLLFFCTTLCWCVCLQVAPLHAQDAPLKDLNGDSLVTVQAFGDSLTYGIGDGIAPGEFLESLPEGFPVGGYPKRLAKLLGVSVLNAGVPGEELLTAGVFRFPTTVGGRLSDFVVVQEGSNDAVRRVNQGEYARAYQRLINVARAEGRELIAVTVLPPVGVHAALQPFTDAYSNAVRDLANVNNLPLADMDRAWRASCPNLEQCRFYNLPEGLHPNALGYDAMAQVIAATLVGVDLFTPTGTTDLESALGLAPGTVVVKTSTASAGVQ